MKINKEKYIKEVDEELVRFLNSRFFKFNPFKDDDKSLEEFLNRQTENYGSELSKVTDFCRFIYVKDVVDDTYNGKNFKKVILGNTGEDFIINFSQFNYYMHPVISRSGLCCNGISSYKVKCTIDYHNVDPYFFLINQGCVLLYMYSFQGITDFQSLKRCYRLMSIEDCSDKNKLRLMVANSQYFVFKYMLRYPDVFANPTNIYMGQRYIGYGLTEDAYLCFSEYYNKYYRFIFEKKIAELENDSPIKLICEEWL